MITCKSWIAGLLAILAGVCALGTASADTLAVIKAGSGSGTVTSNIGAINCGDTCVAPYDNGTPITLTATPVAGSQFIGWLGPCTGTGTCQFTINGATTVSATFASTAIGTPTLDIDGSNGYSALTDGLLIIRYLFGLTGEALIAGAVGPVAARDTVVEMTDYLTDIRPLLDIDGNGQADALSDGLLILRYLSGLRGDGLIADAVGSGAIRTTAATIEAAFASVDPAAGVPPDPETVAPPTDPSVVMILGEATAFLYTGANPIQTGVAPGTIEARRAAVLRGKVRTGGGAALPGVTIAILAHPEFGQTLSRADGAFDLAVNGGGPLTVNYQKTGFLPVQRQVNVPWQDYAAVPDVVMIPLDAQVTAINLDAAAMQAARGSPMTDVDGTRRATLLIPQGTTANLVMANGTTQPITALNVRATEYTVGPNGPQAMPAVLPPTSGYTYAVELSADEAIATGATSVNFSQPLFSYVENFLGFPVGGAVPAGYYDRTKAAWIPSLNGRVIRITSISGGVATVDSVGSGVLPPLAISSAELQQLALLYSTGQELWRVPVTHFTPWDYNWPYGPPDDATAPQVSGPTEDSPLDDPTCSAGSIIECENQTLGESVRLIGTPYTLNYRSARVPGRIIARTLRIPLSGPSVPLSLKRIELKVKVAGRTFPQSFGFAPNQETLFTWDGLDAYGRTLQGRQLATVEIGYVYPAKYKPPSAFAASFAGFGGTAPFLVPNRADNEITIVATFQVKIGLALDARAFGLGGWSLDIHHFYDPVARVLHLGDGTRRSADSLANVITTVAGNGAFAFNGDGGPATQATLNSPYEVAVGPDGRVYISDAGQGRIRRVGLDGIITTVAGNGVFGFSGDGGPATQASLANPFGVALGPDGSLYIADSVNQRIRRAGPDGVITTVAGNGVFGFSGDGGPATQASLATPFGVAVGPDGSLYFTDRLNHRIRRVGPDGVISTVAGSSDDGFSGDGGPATQARLKEPVGVAVGPDGSFYIADANRRIRRVAPEGIITTVAGTGDFAFSGDGGPATQATLGPFGIAVGPDGSLYIPDLDNRRIRQVGPDGVIVTVAGNGNDGFSGDGGAAIQASVSSPFGVAVGPDGSLYIADAFNQRIRRVASPLPGFAAADAAVASEDGRELFVFNSNGRHLRTLDALTGATLLEFGYDATGRLAQVTGKTGGTDNVTTIQHDASGNPTAIVAPFGQSTVLGVDANGFLASITNPAGEQIQLASTTGGLLTSLTDPRGKTSTFGYESDGRLSSDADPAGGAQSLVRTTASGQYTVARATVLGRSTTYKVEDLPGRIRDRAVTAPDGTQAVSEESVDAGTTTARAADGTVINFTSGPDPRFGMAAPVTASLSITRPGSPALVATNTRTAVLTNPLDPLSMTSLTDTATVDGRTTTGTYSAATKTRTTTSPAGRTSSLTIDAFGRLASTQISGIDPGNFTYDSRGRIATITQGSGPTARAITFSYDPAGFLQSITDPIGRTAQMTYDAAGRVVSMIYPDGRTANVGYDAAGNISGLTPPGRPVHGFAYSDRNELTGVTPPTVPGGGPTSYAYNLDKQLTTASRPDGRSITFGYDSGGRLATRSLLTGAVTTGTDTLSYDSAGRLSGIAASSGVTTGYAYSGALLSAETWSGPISGSVARDYDTSFRSASQSVNGADTIAFSYDDDSLLIGAGALTITREPQNGLPTGSTLGVVTTTAGHNGFGEAASYAASANGAAVYSLGLIRDGLGRVSQKTETIGGTTDTYVYTYATSGQLAGVSKNGSAIESYGYDDNRNRTSATVNGVSISATYDAQDRLNQYGTVVYTYNGAGDRLTRTSGGQTTNFAYDQRGNLLGVTLPDATAITYIIDGRNRRVGKKINGALAQGFIYGDRLRPVAELDGTGAVVSRFVYAGRNAPAYMTRGGVTYRIITDQVSSVRLVVDTASGTIAQRIDYDSFGNITQDTNPGFQPFGFASGLYDAQTGLVRFGARDYDAKPGRWTAKDPIGFAGGLNVYAYVENDPVNFHDPTGLLSRSQCSTILAMLASEQQTWTAKTARKFSNTIGSDRMGTQFDNVPIQTAAGTIDFDWFTDLQAFSLVNDVMIAPYAGALTLLGAGNLLTPVEYLVGNTIWGLLNGNLDKQFNMLEVQTVGVIMSGFDTYAELFPPSVLEAAGCSCGK